MSNRHRTESAGKYRTTRTLGAGRLVAGLLILATPAAFPGDWPQWRGPLGTSVSEEKDLPLAWSEEEGVAWRSEIPAWGNSTPAIFEDAILLTSQSGDDLLLMRISKRTGKLLWTRRVGSSETARKGDVRKRREDRGTQHFHDTHNLASPSPVTDGERAIAHFGNGELVAYDLEGRLAWRRNLQEDYGTYTIWWGHANSPVLYENLVISVCMQDSLEDLGRAPAPSYAVAHDKRTGAERWRTARLTGARAEANDSYTTPIFRRSGDRDEMIVLGGTWLDAYDPRTGAQLWCLKNLGGNRVITGPTIDGDLVFGAVGMRGPVFAARPRREGELSGDDVLWRWTKGTPDGPSLVASRGLLFMVNNQGIARCLDARTGDLQWETRISGEYRATPLVADGRVYFLNMDGLTTVVALSRRFEKLAENRVDDRTIASLAVSDGRIYLRGHKALYAIGTR